MRWRNTHLAALTSEHMGGRLAHKTTVNINGGSGILAVAGFEAKPRSILAKLKKQHKDAGSFFYGGSLMGYAIIKGDGMVTRILLVTMQDIEKCVAFGIQQTEADYMISIKPPHKHLLKHVPAFPGSTPTFFMHAEETNTRIAISTVNTEPEIVRKFYDGTLKDKGWISPFPTSDRTEVIPATIIRLKGDDVCCISVEDSGGQNGSTITILYKTLQVK